MDLNGNTVGRASLGTMCSGSRSSGISQDGGRSLDGVAATASHELGHIFGMTHDDRKQWWYIIYVYGEVRSGSAG